MEKILDRFLRYVKINTMSDSTGLEIPTTDCQWDLARLLADELKAMGLEDAAVSDHCVVTAHMPSNLPKGETRDKIGFIAHIDTVDDFNGKNVKPRVIENYDGSDIFLDSKEKFVLSPDTFPTLLDNVGKTLIVTDGSTLLGADDKAGIAEIMTMLSYLTEHPEIKHGQIGVAFSPDEEGAGGIRYLDVKAFDCDYAYTVDGGALGELEFENFNAATFTVEINGREVHPGEGKDKMVNASLLAMEFASLMPSAETPAHTEKYEGFYHLQRMEGGPSFAKLEYLLREHDTLLFEKRKLFVKQTVDYLNKKYGCKRFKLNVRDSYYNMRDMIEPHIQIVEKAAKAMTDADVEPKIQPVRGGTDGAYLCFRGLPCPNLSAGGYNFHGRYEYIPLESMEKMVEVLTNIAVNVYEE